MPIHIYPSNNNPKKVKNLWIYFLSNWKKLKSVSVYTGGRWKLVYKNEFDPITINGGTDVNIRNRWQERYPGETPAGLIRVTIAGNCVASSTGTYGLDTGTWPNDIEGLIININPGVFIAGKGGNGASGRAGGGAGGPAMRIQHACTIDNFGTIGGGGGGGAGGATPSNCCGNMCGAPGGGGAGSGTGGSNCLGTAGNGSISSGGGPVSFTFFRATYSGGAGGGLGRSGGNAPHNASATNYGGSPGASIVRSSGIGYTLINAGTVTPSPA